MEQQEIKVLKKEEGYVVLECALCEGMRADPILGVGKCPTCGGKGTVRVMTPYVQCHYCGGTGLQYDRHGSPRSMTCVVCKGKGAVHVTGDVKECPACKGSGRTLADEFGLPCTICSGKGMVPASGYFPEGKV